MDTHSLSLISKLAPEFKSESVVHSYVQQTYCMFGTSGVLIGTSGVLKQYRAMKDCTTGRRGLNCLFCNMGQWGNWGE